ncbi:cupin domain-containing protein [Roseivirga sp. E12]|uniref:cupin domain-containing protein n=1 Tax=Roseivirga sp. E12 TaxID=2819237 RepID=UPI001ABCDD89|nr:cupin domain-containing protein [Roseivirga sp. E12]MBO3698101.1 cupin domain-containing protein [Roseivirga sp. E12]
MYHNQAQIILPGTDLNAEMSYFERIGFRLDNIFPDDDPEVAVMSGYGIQLRIDRSAKVSPPSIHILSDNPKDILGIENQLLSPGGTVITVGIKTYQVPAPLTKHKFEVRKLRDEAPWVIGRAGMQYRDLVPDRLGGGIMASHIRIPNGGPVPDMVHYHTIGFQLIYCYRGWVKLVYEDQGPPFILSAGDCVTQPPEIRHRVLEASDNLEVIEIGVPAEHMTTIDHEMELPTSDIRPEREFGNQTFCHHQVKEASWSSDSIKNLQYRDTGIHRATMGVASVKVYGTHSKHGFSQTLSHQQDILFSFVTEGSFSLQVEGHPVHNLEKGDAFVIPPNLNYQFTDYSADLELLEVALP